jgi:hypothetical protein
MLFYNFIMVNVKRLVEKRREMGKTGAIFPTARGRLTGGTLRRVADRYKKRLGYPAFSHDSVIRDYKTKGVFLEIPATKVAQRFVKKELISGVVNLNLSSRQKRLVEHLIYNKSLKIPGTNINSSPPNFLFLLELVNSCGEKKSLLILNKLTKRAKAIQRLAQMESKKTKHPNDIFMNVAANIGFIETEFLMEMENKKDFALRVDGFIKKRSKELVQISEMDVPNKKFYMGLLFKQKKRALIQKIIFEDKAHMYF